MVNSKVGVVSGESSTVGVRVMVWVGVIVIVTVIVAVAVAVAVAVGVFSGVMVAVGSGVREGVSVGSWVGDGTISAVPVPANVGVGTIWVGVKVGEGAGKGVAINARIGLSGQMTRKAQRSVRQKTGITTKAKDAGKRDLRAGGGDGTLGAAISTSWGWLHLL